MSEQTLAEKLREIADAPSINGTLFHERTSRTLREAADRLEELEQFVEPTVAKEAFERYRSTVPADRGGTYYNVLAFGAEPPRILLDEDTPSVRLMNPMTNQIIEVAIRGEEA